MRAAIYCRKSTDDKDKGEENQSVTRQKDLAIEYAKSQEWTVDEDHVCIDDNVKGSTFPRAGLTKLMKILPEVDFVVMQKPDRLGRDQTHTPFHRTKIRKKARLFYYGKDEEAIANTPIDKYLEQTFDLIGAMEIELSSERSREALVYKAKKGYNTGGIIYGYDNVWVYPDGREIKAVRGEEKLKELHTEFRINKEQSKTINQIYKMYVDGFGVSTIAKTMNGDPRYEDKNKRYFKGANPDSPRKGTGSWAPSSVRSILHNERYIGKITFGKIKKVREDGQTIRVKQDESTWQIIDAPELRIIPPALWNKVRKQAETAKKTYVRNTDGTLWGRPGSGIESRYLLTGLAHCGCCGSNIANVGGRKGSYYYGCSYHQNRGKTICDNSNKVQMKKLDNAVLNSIENILTPDVITYTIDLALKKIVEQQKTDPDKSKRLEKELAQVQHELNNFMDLIATGKAPDSIMEQIQIREQRIAQLKAELNEATLEQPIEMDLRRTKNALIDRMSMFKELIYSDVPRARQALRKLIDGHIIVSPNNGKGVTFEGNTQLGSLIDPCYIKVASPRGFEPLLPP